MRWKEEASPTFGGEPVRRGGPLRRGGAWLQLRSTSYFNDRLKEVSNRLLARWKNSRDQSARSAGTPALTLDDLIEIAQLSDAQLDSSEMAEGARELSGLEGWDLTRRSELRPHWRFLASLPPEQLQLAQSAAGVPFTRMSLAQQQQFLAMLPAQLDPFRSLIDLGAASLQVAYTTPGEFEWKPLEPDASPARRPQAS